MYLKKDINIIIGIKWCICARHHKYCTKCSQTSLQFNSGNKKQLGKANSYSPTKNNDRRLRSC